MQHVTSSKGYQIHAINKCQNLVEWKNKVAEDANTQVTDKYLTIDLYQSTVRE